MQKIVPFLWYDKEAGEAAELYTSVFGGKIKSRSILTDTPSGNVEVLTIEIMDHEFQLMSAGPLFKFNPSVSFSVAVKTKEEVDAIWNKLLPGGKILMELGAYPYSERYGWLEDKYGLSWQIIAINDKPITQSITPSLMYVGDVCGKAEEAMNFYASIFPDSKVNAIWRYTADQAPDKEGTVAHGGFNLSGQEFIAMDSARMHDFKFNEAISHMVYCKDQAEIDYYWEKLSADPKAEQCGWLKDKYGLSWQIVPRAMDEMMSTADKEAKSRVTQAFLKMKKFDLATLERAFKGE